MPAGINEQGAFQKTAPARVRPVPPANYFAAENERVGGQHSFQASYSRAGNGSTQTVWVPFDDYPQTVKSILGYTILSGTPGQLTRFLPYRDPRNHGMYAQAVSVRGVSPDGFAEWVPANPPRWPLRTHSRFLWAELTITFGTVRHQLAADEFDQIDSVNQLNGEVRGKDPLPGLNLDGFAEQQRYCVKDVREAREFVTALPGGFVRSADGVGPPPLADANRYTVPFPIPQILSYADITVTWLDVPYAAIPFQAIQQAAGRVNHDILELPDRPPPRFYGAETLLLQSYSFEEVYFPDADSSRACNVIYHFRWRGGKNAVDLDRPNWNSVPIPRWDGTGKIVSPFTRVFRKPILNDTAFSKNSKGDFLGIFDVFNFEYLFRPARTIVFP